MDKPLEVRVTDDGLLTISIGIGTLAYAFENNEENNPFVESAGEFIQTYQVANPLEFARDVRIAMLREKEDGSNPLTVFLDKVCWDAVEDGSGGIDWEDE